MKKIYSILLLTIGSTLNSNAQTRLSLYEEFTGENCSPCAYYNPSLDSLTINAANASKVLVLKYQMPFGGPTTIYAANPEEADNRSTFYNIASLPQGRLDGSVPFGTSGNIADMTQAIVTDAAAISAPFNITISSVVIGTSSLSATVTVVANANVAFGTMLKLRVALVEDLQFDTPPGSNGETHFPHVVREMYPNASGQSIVGTWTAGSSQSFSISGIVPSIVNAKNYKFLAVWIQDDASWNVKQAARSFSLNEVGSTNLSTSSKPGCGSPINIATEVTLRNLGSNNLTSAKIFYRQKNTALWQSQVWTGSVPFQGMVTVPLADINVSTIGNILLEDSVALPNGLPDSYTNNNKSSVSKIILANTAGTFPITENFDGPIVSFTPYAEAGKVPLDVQLPSMPYGYNGSTGYLFYDNQHNPIAGSGYSILPFANLPSGHKTLSFQLSYAQLFISGHVQGQDKLEVVYSTDCGNTWISVWSSFGPALATTTPSGGTYHPTINSQWALKNIDVSEVPTGAQIAFRATSVLGNCLYIDDVNLHADGTSINEELVDKGSISIFPNPATEMVTLKLVAKADLEAKIQIVDIVGKISSMTTYSILKGENTIELNTTALPPGSYFANIISKEGTTSRKFFKL